MNVACDRVASRQRRTTFVPTTSSAVMVGAMRELLPPAALGVPRVLGTAAGTAAVGLDTANEGTLSARETGAVAGEGADPPNRPAAQAAVTPSATPTTIAS